MIVWDMRRHSNDDLDEFVQFWIDLIQARAPGSSMIVVGTHMDEACSLIPQDRKAAGKFRTAGSSRHNRRRQSRRRGGRVDSVKAIVDALRRRLEGNETARLRAIEEDIRLQRGNLAELKNLRKRRPHLVDVVPVSCVRNLEGFGALTEIILRISTPSEQVPYPFQLVNIEIPSYYRDVKDEVEAMICEDHVATMSQVHAVMEDRIKSKKGVEHTRDAVAFLASVGEVCSCHFCVSLASVYLDLAGCIIGGVVWGSFSVFCECWCGGGGRGKVPPSGHYGERQGLIAGEYGGHH